MIGIGFLALSLRKGMLYPVLWIMPSLSLSTRWVRYSFVACGFFPNFHARKTIGAETLTRLPPGPAGSMPTKVFLKTGGFVDSVVR